MTRDIIKVLMGFQHWEAQRITGMATKRGTGGECKYPFVVEAMESAGIHPIRVHIKRLQTTILERMACRPVYSLFMEAERITGTSRLVRWWDKYAVNEPAE